MKIIFAALLLLLQASASEAANLAEVPPSYLFTRLHDIANSTFGETIEMDQMIFCFDAQNAPVLVGTWTDTLQSIILDEYMRPTQMGTSAVMGGDDSYYNLDSDTLAYQIHILRDNTLVRGGTLQADALIIGYDYNKGVEIPVQRISCYGRLK